MNRPRLLPRLRQLLTRRRPAERCRPVTVMVDGEEITVPVLAEEPMSEEGREALAQIIIAARRMFDAQPPDPDRCPNCGFHTRSSIHRRRCEVTR